MANKISLNDDDYGGQYEPSDSEDEYTEHEKNLLKKVRQKRRRSDDEEEVMRFDDSQSDDEDDIVDNSDFDEEGYDDIPGPKAWGKRRSAYYNTDFVDQDYSTYNEQEEELARQEEEEAREIQLRLAKQLDEADFTLDVFSKDTEEKPEADTGTEKLKADLSDLSVRQKEQLFQKDSPEFAGLVQDFEKYLHESDAVLSPVIEYANTKGLKLPAVEFARIQNNVILTYCTNISFYLLLKAKRIPVKNHPIVKRLVQLKQLLEQLNEKYEKVVKSQLEILLDAINSGVDVSFAVQQSKPVQKKLKMMKQFDKNIGLENESGVSSGEEQPDESEEISGKSDGDESEMDAEDESKDVDDRRGITYQIAKNKGLTPHRKKELRNPRVKHRNKYRKALVRRKGAVRSVRKELKRYSGEISGIKSTVKKGIKIKS